MRCLSLIAAVVMLNVICSTGKTVKEKLTPTRNSEKNQSLNFVVRRANEFSIGLFQKLSSLVPVNAVFAPYEYFISVSMASYPAMNSLQISVIEALLAEGYSVNVLLGLKALVEKIESYKSFNFNSVNKIFYRIGFERVAEFRSTVNKNILTKPQALDFDDPTEASRIINKWFKNTTQNRISNVVQFDDLLPHVYLYHINVIHFKRSWLRPFTLVGADDFYVHRMKRIKIPFMRQLDFFEYGKLPNINSVFIRIPYENESLDDGISMFIILPNKVVGLAQLKKMITVVKMDQPFRGEHKEILLFVPKFKIESKFTVTKPLEKLLSRKANVTNKPKQSNPFPRSSKFIQRVLFEVDEKSEFNGENASVTPGTPTLKINRPFIFIITTTGKNRVILFTGFYNGS